MSWRPPQTWTSWLLLLLLMMMMMTMTLM